MQTTKDIAEIFVNALEAKQFTIDKTGQKTIEIIGASFLADKPAIFGTVNEAYVNAELKWYESESTNITDIYPEGDKEPPQAWQYTANIHGEINSNYGHLIYSEKYYNQFENVVVELHKNKDSRRASMIYQRPSIWKEYNENGKNDFICTNAVTYYIRDDKLNCVVQMRSNDVVFGYKNDFAWQQFVLNELAEELSVKSGDIVWQAQNLHVYERHFDLVK
jgi:thymidylate synthase